ncbi:MAG: RsiV family protein [Opitutales bacterium]|nr:RsiV family protein [Opitutales bacterium]
MTIRKIFALIALSTVVPLYATPEHKAPTPTIIEEECGTIKIGESDKTTYKFESDIEGIPNLLFEETKKYLRGTFKINYASDGEAENIIEIERVVSVDWPAKINDRDLSGLQKELFGGTDLELQIDKFLHDPTISGISENESYTEYKFVNKNKTVNQDFWSCMFESIFIERYLVSDSLVCYKITRGCPGGAHPNYDTDTLIYDLSDNRKLEFKDIFLAGKEAKLFETQKEALCCKWRTESFSDAAEREGIWEDSLRERWLGDEEGRFLVPPEKTELLLTKSGIVFQYSHYEIGPWASGCIEIEVPYHELEDCFTPDFMRRLKKMNFSRVLGEVK